MDDSLREKDYNAEDVLNEARTLLRRISSSRGSPEANDLHKLASILEIEEIRYIQQVGFAFMNTRASYTIGRLVLLLRDNDELFELINSKLLIEPGYTIQLRAAAARLLLALISSYLFRNFFDDVTLSKIKEWVGDDSSDDYNFNSFSKNFNEKSNKKGKKKKILKNFDKEMLKTYSTGLLASALILEDTVDDVVRAGLVPKLMKFLRSRTIGFNTTDADTESHQPTNISLPTSSSHPSSSSLKSRENARSHRPHVHHVDSANREIQTEGDISKVLKFESQTKDLVDEIAPRGSFAEYAEKDENVQMKMSADISPCEENAEKNKGKAVVKFNDSAEFENAKVVPGEKNRKNLLDSNDSEEENDDVEEDKNKNLPKKSYYAKKKTWKSPSMSTSNAHVTQNALSSSSSSQSRVKRLNLDRISSTSKDLNPKLASEEDSTINDVQMRVKGTEERGEEEVEEEGEEDKTGKEEKAEDKVDLDLELLEKETDLDKIMHMAAMAAKEEATYLNSPSGVVENAVRVANDYVKTSFAEELSKGGDAVEALKAAKAHASSIIQTAKSVKKTYSIGLEKQLKSTFQSPNPDTSSTKDKETENDKNVPDSSDTQTYLPNLEELACLREKYCIQCLASLGEYLEALGPVLQDRGVDVCLNLLKRKDELLLTDILRFVCSLAAHRKFSTTFVDRGGVQLLLKVNRTIHTHAGLAVCLFALASLQGVMERVCALPSNIVKEVVDLAIQLLSCPQDVARKNAALFFGASFVFPNIIHEFDHLDGLPRLIDPLQSITAARSTGSTPNNNVSSSINLHIPPVMLGPDRNPLPVPASLGSFSRGFPEGLNSTGRQVAQHACIAFRQYMRAHFLILIESLKGRVAGSKGVGEKGKNNAKVFNKILDLNDECVENTIEEFQKDRKIATAFVRCRHTALESIADLGGITLLLELSQLNPIERVYGEISLSALGALQIATLLPSLHRAVTVCVLPNQKSGISVILDAASGTLIPDPEFMHAALLVLVNLVCYPSSLCSRTNPSATSSMQIPSSLDPIIPPPVGDRRISLGTAGGSLGLAACMEHSFRLARDSIRSSNGIKLLLHVLNSRTLLHPAFADCLRALCCKILLGLAYDASIAQILSKLQVGNLLSDFLKDNSRAVEKNKWSNEFQKLALQLITLTSSVKTNHAAATSEVVAPTLRRIERASIAASTPISFSQEELLRLIHSHLLHHGLGKTANLLLEEANIHPISSTSFSTPLSKNLNIPPLSTPNHLLRPPPLLNWPIRNQSQPFMSKVNFKPSLPATYRGINSHPADSAAKKKWPCITPVHLRKPYPSVCQVAKTESTNKYELDKAIGVERQGEGNEKEKERVQNHSQTEHLQKNESIPEQVREEATFERSVLTEKQVQEEVNLKTEERVHLNHTDHQNKQELMQNQQQQVVHLQHSQVQTESNASQKNVLASVGLKRNRDFEFSTISSPPSKKSNMVINMNPSMDPLSSPSTPAAVSSKDSIITKQESTIPNSSSHELACTLFATPLTTFTPFQSPVLNPNSSFTVKYELPAGESTDVRSFSNYTDHLSPSLDSIVCSWLKNQHKECHAPITTLPPLSLLHPHVCPDSKRVFESPLNVVHRIFARQVSPPNGGRRGGYHDRHFTYSRFRAWRTCRDEGSSLSTCMSFLNSTNQLAVGNIAGEIRLFETHGGSLLDVFVGHTHPVLSVECFPTSFQYFFNHEEENINVNRLLTSSRNEVKLWDVDFQSGPMLTFKQFRNPKFDHSGNRFAAIGIEHSIYSINLFDVETGQSIVSFPEASPNDANSRSYFLSKIHFNPSDELLLWNGYLIDYRVPKNIHRFDQFTDYGGGGFHPHGNEIILNSEVWDARTWKLLRTVESLNQTNINFNPTGDVIFANLRRSGEDVADFASRKRRRHPLFTSFSTIDAVEYVDIAMEDVNRQVVELVLEQSNTFVGVVALDEEEDESVVKVYEIGRKRPSDYDSDADDGEDTEGESEGEEEEDDIEELLSDGMEADLNVDEVDEEGQEFDEGMSGEEEDMDGNSEYDDDDDSLSDEEEVMRMLSENGAGEDEDEDEDGEDEEQGDYEGFSEDD